MWLLGRTGVILIKGVLKESLCSASNMILILNVLVKTRTFANLKDRGILEVRVKRYFNKSNNASVEGFLKLE